MTPDAPAGAGADYQGRVKLRPQGAVALAQPRPLLVSLPNSGAQILSWLEPAPGRFPITMVLAAILSPVRTGSSNQGLQDLATFAAGSSVLPPDGRLMSLGHDLRFAGTS